MIVCLVLAGYLAAGLITGLIYLRTTKEVLPEMFQILGINSLEEFFMIDISKAGQDPTYKSILGLVFFNTNLGFLVMVLIWPLMAWALLHDFIEIKLKKGGDK